MIAIRVIFSSSITSQNYPFFLVVGIIKFQSLNKFADCSTVLLSIFIISCIGSLWLIYYSLQVCTPNNSELIPPPAIPR